MKPSIGRIVHYVSYGTPGGEYSSECRPAIITKVYPSDGEGTLAEMNGPEEVHLTIFYPDGDFRKKCRHSEGSKTGGTWHWPERES